MLNCLFRHHFTLHNGLYSIQGAHKKSPVLEVYHVHTALYIQEVCTCMCTLLIITMCKYFTVLQAVRTISIQSFFG